ncbi:alpha/beta hydrolase [Streptomyces rapamycinicus]|uniref:Alpha/beta hydrolase n=1 Tax=Streptomyces rhizosphaericus TaxID=114699 RepID=A0A6G4AB27_9ACTN|nr:alpha/beta hydrolase [Streptomyces rhizosphaericus]NEW69901.1 alpha/beta hydrolase [Streptomyces rhizosphaericus]
MAPPDSPARTEGIHGDRAGPARFWRLGHPSRAPDQAKREEVEDLHLLLRHLGHERAFVVGTDVGTMTVHAWAQAYPHEVERLALSEAYLPGYGLEDHPPHRGSWHFGFHAQSDLAAMLTAGKEEPYLTGFWSMMTRGGITAADRADLLRTYTRPDAMRGGFEHYATLMPDGRAARVGGPLTMPALILNGEHGLPQNVLLDGARQAAADVRADIVPGAAHTFAADTPAWTADRLARFFTGVWWTRLDACRP